ncbi:putative inner membrane transporter YedA [Thalassocella blandensis]|nr:putative inner membrane transporter YedA [Thalassocella blandensis]
MQVGLAYLCVVLVWATTPIGIKWSNSSLTFIEAITARTVFSLLLCGLILLVLRKPFVSRRSDWYVYFAGSLSLFPNMLIVYWSAQYIPSGLIAVVFGFFPFMVGLFSLLILKDNIFTVRRIVAMVIAIAGLIIINTGQLNLGGNAVLGVLGVLASTMFFAFSSVLIKRIGVEIDPFRQTTGSLAMSAPWFLLVWFFFDGQIPSTIDQRSLIGVSYLVLAGTVVGGTLFYYVLKNCTVASVGLITFITPILAIVIGVVLDGESLPIETLIGCGLVIFSLAVYLDLFRFIVNKFRRVMGVDYAAVSD